MKHAFKKVIALLLAVMMIVGILPTVFAAATGHFTDVDDDSWYAPFVKYVYEHDPQLMNGMTENTFEPDTTCNRAMAAVTLYRLSGETVTEKSTFVDLDPNVKWYQEGIAWAQKTGVVNGVGDNKFAPTEGVTREQLVTMMWRYAGKPAPVDGTTTELSDKNEVGNFAKDAMDWAISIQMIQGDHGKIYPKRIATRAEYAKILATFAELKPCEEHKWKLSKITKEPTCTEDGEGEYVCSVCGETKTDVVPALGHDWVDGKCSRCGITLADKDEIVIYYTNDVHTYIDDDLSYDNIAELKTQTAKVASGVLLLDAGDHIQGTAYGSLDKGANIIKLMNAAKYDAATLGNHEFDYDMPRILEIIDNEAEFPYVAANFYHLKEDGTRGDPVTDAYKIFEVGGKKIAVVGLVTPESFTKSTPKYFQNEKGEYIYGLAEDVTGATLYEVAQEAIDAARAENPDYVILLGHLGDDPSSKPWTSEEVIANTTGADAFIDGHSHSTVPMKTVKNKEGKDVVLTQTGSYFNAVGRMSITAEGIKTELMTEFTGSDEAVAKIKNDWIAKVDEQLGEKIATSDVDLVTGDATGRLVRKQETNLGDFVADALYYYMNDVEELDVDFAIMNGGGIRANIDKGDVTYKTCKTVHTFGNVGCVMEITGEQLLKALEWGARGAGTGEEIGGFLHVSGVTYEIHTYLPSTVTKDDKEVFIDVTGEYRVKNVKVWNKETKAYEDLDPAKTYRLAGYNYTLRDLGDGFSMFTGATLVKDYIMEDYMLLANYAKAFKDQTINDENKPIDLPTNYANTYGAGRITLVDTKPVTPTPTGNEYVLKTELADGDKVVFVNKAHNKALSQTPTQSYYLTGVDVTPTDNKLVDPAAELVFTVEIDGDVTYLKDANGVKLAISINSSTGELSSGLTFDDSSEYNAWKIVPATTADCVYIENINAPQGSSGDPRCVEWYESKDRYSMYYLDTADDSLFAMQMYVLGESGGSEEKTGVQFAVMSTSDMHGKAWDQNLLNDTKISDSMLNVATAVQEVRSKYDNTILIDNGDTYEGQTISTYNIQKLTTGATKDPNPMALAMKYIGYDVSVLGNHEFNFAWSTMSGIYNYLKEENEDGGSIAVLASDLYYDGTDDHAKNTHAFDPYKIFTFEVEGKPFKIAVIGMENTDCPRWDVKDNYPGINFGYLNDDGSTDIDLANEVNRVQAEIKEEVGDVDFTIVAIHTGRGSGKEPVFSSTSESQGLWVVQNTTGVDMFVLGHDHSAMNSTDYTNKNGEKVVVVNGGQTVLTDSVFEITKEADGSFGVELVESTNLKLSGYAVDATLKEKLQHYADEAQTYIDTPVGQITGDWDAPLSNTRSYYLQQHDDIDTINRSSMYGGNLGLAKKYGDEAKQKELFEKTGLDHITVDVNTTSVNLTKAGCTLKTPTNNVTMKDIYSIYRYENSLYLLALKGSEIKEIMEYVAQNRLKVTVAEDGTATFSTTGDNFTNPVFYGLKFKYNMANEPGNRVEIESFANGDPFDLDKVYIIGINNYHLGNGPFAKYSSDSEQVIWSQLNDEGGGCIQNYMAELIKKDTDEKGTFEHAPSEWEIVYEPSSEPTPDPEPAGAKFVKVTETAEDLSGEYLIVVTDKNVAYNGASNSVANETGSLNGAENGVEVTINADGTIDANETTRAITFTLEKTETGYKVTSKGGTTIGWTSGTGVASNPDYSLKLEFDEEGHAKLIVQDDSRQLMYSFKDGAASNTRFRFYSTSSVHGEPDSYGSTYYLPCLFKLTE